MPASKIINNEIFKIMRTIGNQLDKEIFETMRTIGNQLDKEILAMSKTTITPTQFKQLIGEDNFKRFEANCTKPIETVLKETEKHQLIIDSFSWYNSIEALEVGSSDFGFKFWSDVNEMYIDKILKR